MKHALALAAVMLLCGAQDDERIARLIRDLSSDRFETRDAAAGELAAIGKPAVPALKALVAHEDPEVRAQAAAVLAKIEAARKAKALKLTVAADKKVYRPGERVKLVAKLENVEDFPVTAIKFVYDGGIHADSWIRVARDGKNLRVAGDPLPQVMVHRTFTEDRFHAIAGGESTVVRGVDFAGVWDLGGNDPSLKASYREGKVVDLPVGTYQVKATYRFAFDPRAIDGEDRHFGRLEWKFEGDSRRLLRECWTGSLEAETEFEVKQ